MFAELCRAKWFLFSPFAGMSWIGGIAEIFPCCTFTKKIGRIYSDVGQSGEQWFYALNGRDSAHADSFEDAKARLKEEWMSIRSLEEQAERCVELAQQFPDKEAERILRMLAVDLLLKATQNHPLPAGKRF